VKRKLGAGREGDLLEDVWRSSTTTRARIEVMGTDVYCIGSSWPGRLCISPRPRGGDWLADEIAAWHTIGADTVMSLLTHEEVTELELQDEATHSQSHGICFRTLPIPDRGLPGSDESVDALIDARSTELESDKLCSFIAAKGSAALRWWRHPRSSVRAKIQNKR
jgi:hypothetical protein